MRRFLRHPYVRTHISQLTRFAVCGGIGTTIDFGTLTILVELVEVPPYIAYVPSSLLAVIFVFTANKFFTFKNRERDIGRQALKFAFVYGTAIISNLSISWTLLWIGFHYLLAKAIAIGIGALWNYSMSHGFVFKKNEGVDVAIV